MAWKMSVGYCFFFPSKKTVWHIISPLLRRHNIPYPMQNPKKNQLVQEHSRALPGYNIHQTVPLYNFLYSLPIMHYLEMENWRNLAFSSRKLFEMYCKSKEHDLTSGLTCIWRIEPRGMDETWNTGLASVPVKTRRALANPSRHSKSYLHTLFQVFTGFPKSCIPT